MATATATATGMRVHLVPVERAAPTLLSPPLTDGPARKRRIRSYAQLSNIAEELFQYRCRSLIVEEELRYLCCSGRRAGRGACFNIPSDDGAGARDWLSARLQVNRHCARSHPAVYAACILLLPAMPIPVACVASPNDDTAPPPAVQLLIAMTEAIAAAEPLK